MPFQIIRNDITKVKADAIVNTANPKPVVGRGTDGAIYATAGMDKLLEERKKIGPLERGAVAKTPAFGLKAKYIIHTVGPAWHGGKKGEFETLHQCYRNSLELAFELGCKSIAFPLIATGVYGFPKDQALQIAMGEISAFLMRDDVDMTVKLVVFDDTAFRLSKNLFLQVESFISDEEVLEAHHEEYHLSRDDRMERRTNRRIDTRANLRSTGNVPRVLDFSDECELPEALSEQLLEPSSITYKLCGSNPLNEHTFDKEKYMNDGKDDMAFQNHLLKLIIEKNIDNKTVYKRSNISRGAFSKIMSGDTKVPKKKAVLGFCIGLKLNLEEAKELLASADMAFNPYNKRDKLIIQCIETGQYNVDAINAMLYLCKQPLLGTIDEKG